MSAPPSVPISAKSNATPSATSAPEASSGAKSARAPKTKHSPTRGAPSEPQTFAQAHSWLWERGNIETSPAEDVDPASAFTLSRITALCKAIGDPQGTLVCVHVAGSKGKGSICEMVASALGGCGLRVGLFTSPHLIDVRERIRIAGVVISEQDFLKGVQELFAPSVKVSKKLGEPSAFELLTALAFRHFSRQKVDVAVIEVGMGGTGDATNIILPAVCAVGMIQLEHTRWLGDTLARIAMHKGGIFKKGVPALTVDQDENVIAELRRCAEDAGTTLRVLGKDVPYTWHLEHSKERGPHYTVTYPGGQAVASGHVSLAFEKIVVPLMGEHQAVNCALALAIIDTLAAGGTGGGGSGAKKSKTPALSGTLAKQITAEGVIKGLATTSTAGRMERIWKEPKVFIDGAHTPASVQGLVKTIAAHLRLDSIIAVFGCAADKDIDGMLQNLAMCADKVVFTRATGNARAADPEALRRRYTELTGKQAQVEPTVKGAVNTAYKSTAKNDAILVTGSFAVAGEVKRLFAEKFGAKGA